MPDSKALVWVDLETTGTNEEQHAIVEIGLILTDLDLNERASLQSVIDPYPYDPIGGWSEFITNMHTESGLLDALDTARRAGTLPTLEQVDESIESLLQLDHDEMGLRPHHYLLAGSGVSHFDRRFIKHYLPGLERWLQYPNLDVGSTRREMQVLGFDDLIPPFNDGKTHRAMDDVRCHLEELRARRELWATLRTAKAAREIDVVFDGPPDVHPLFLWLRDVESGEISNAGAWRQTDSDSDNWALRLRHLPSSADRQITEKADGD